MKPVTLSLEISATNAFLYSGYLYVFLTDGSIGCINFNRLLWLVSMEDYDEMNFLKLIFLPNRNLKGETYNFLLDFKEIKSAIDNVIKKAFNRRVKYNVDEADVNSILRKLGSFDELPLDVRLYCGELFVGSESGLYRSKLNIQTGTPVIGKKLNRIFDASSISLNARGGVLAVSADYDGLFAYNLFSSGFMSDRPSHEKRSIRTDWSKSFSLVNYSTNDLFTFILNEVGQMESQLDLPVRYRDDTNSKKAIMEVGESYVNMDDMISKQKFEESDIIYSLNSLNSGFFLLKDGQLEVRNLLTYKDDWRYSTKSIYTANLRRRIKNEKPLSAITVPKGCVFEFYDKIILVQNGEITEIGSEPAFSIRSYMTSHIFQNLVTIVYENHIDIVALHYPPSPRNKATVSYKSEVTDFEVPERHDAPDNNPVEFPF